MHTNRIFTCSCKFGIVCSQGVKPQPGKGRNILENVFPQHLWFGLFVYPTWCGTVYLSSEWWFVSPKFCSWIGQPGRGSCKGRTAALPHTVGITQQHSRQGTTAYYKYQWPLPILILGLWYPSTIQTLNLILGVKYSILLFSGFTF